MICYKDRTFCASKTKNHTCGRELSREDQKNAIALKLPVSYMKFCTEQEETHNVLH